MDFIQHMDVWKTEERILAVLLFFSTIWVTVFFIFQLFRKRNLYFKNGKYSIINETKIDFDYNPNNDGSTYDFRVHPVFSTISELLEVGLRTIELGDEFRDTVIKDIIRITWTGNREVILDILSECEDAKNIYQLQHIITSNLSKRIEQIEKDLKAEGIPEIAIDRYNRSTNIFNEFLFAYIKLNFTSKRTRIEAIDLFLKAIQANIETLRRQFEFIFSTINGQLKGTIYKGLVCET
ncbi:hypothetical protein [Leptospira sp. 'Mane']|uniref:hypothetical protein n=1 Tax=Leptospira sp. 'Mane' TaxID=3387407 RepID=UPI00398B39B0